MWENKVNVCLAVGESKNVQTEVMELDRQHNQRCKLRSCFKIQELDQKSAVSSPRSNLYLRVGGQEILSFSVPLFPHGKNVALGVPLPPQEKVQISSVTV